MNKKIMPYIIFGVPLLIGGFFLYKYLKSKKEAKGEDAPSNYDKSQDANVETKTRPDGNTSTSSSSTKYFPLKKGSRGAKVKELQQAILKYDSKLLPKFGADSDFGSETENAINTILGKTSIASQEEIDSIISKADSMKKSEETKKAVEVANTNRSNLAQKLVALAKGKGGSKDFYAIHKTSIVPYQITTDGRQIQQSSKVLNVGDRIKIDSDTTYKIDSKGNIQAYIDKDLMKSFSPYAFEVR